MYSIEFFGLPGSGKTTLFNIISKYFESIGVTVLSHRNFYQILNDYYFPTSEISKNSHKSKNFYRKVYKYSWFLRFTMNNTRYVALCLFSIFNMKVNFSTKVRFLRWLVKEGAAWEFFSNSNISNKIIINDEGFIHRAVSMAHGSKLSDRYIKKYFRVCPASDTLVILEVDWLKLLSRRTITSEPFALIFDVKDEEERETLLGKMNNNIKNMIRLFPNSRMKIELDGSLDPIKNVNKIVELIHFNKAPQSK